MASSATIWEGPSDSIPAVNADGNIYEETHIAVAGQTVYNLLTFTYTPDTKTIFVVRDGFMLRRAVDFSETDNDTVTMALAATGGERVTFIAYAIAQVNPPMTLDGLPMGGSSGQILQKQSGSDYDAVWVNAGAVSSSLLDAVRQNVASAPTIDLTGIIKNQTRNIRITGGVQIDGFAITDGEVWAVQFAASLTLNNNINIVTQSGKAIRTTPGDTCFIRAIAINTVEIIGYSRASQGLLVPNFNNFRLTLTSGDAVPSADVAAGATLYLTPYNGTKISLFNGVSWVVRDSDEISVALAGLTINTPYDVFAYDNAGTVVIEYLAWASATARATNLAKQDNILVKSGDATRKYIGTFYATGVAQATDTARQRLIWNNYNRVRRTLQRSDAAASWNYSVAAYRIAGGAAANRVEVCAGLSEETISLTATGSSSNAGATGTCEFITAIGEDTTGSATPNSVIGRTMNASAGGRGQTVATLNKQPDIGFHYYAWLEQVSSTAAVTTWFGVTNSGLQGSWNC